MPAQPPGFSAAPGTGQVTLIWDDPSDANITKYQFRQKENDGAFGSWIDIPDGAPGEANDGSYTVMGLSNGTAYTFAIRAASATGNGAVSYEVITTPAGLPGAPGGLAATPGHRQVVLSWTASADNGSAIIKHQSQGRWEFPTGPGTGAPACSAVNA